MVLIKLELKRVNQINRELLCNITAYNSVIKKNRGFFSVMRLNCVGGALPAIPTSTAGGMPFPAA